MNPYTRPQPPSSGNRLTRHRSPRERIKHWNAPNKQLGLTINTPTLPPTLSEYNTHCFNGTFEDYYYFTPHVIKEKLIEVFSDTECLLTECLQIALAALGSSIHNDYSNYALTMDGYLSGFIESMEDPTEDVDENGNPIGVDWNGQEGYDIGQAMFYICCDLYHMVTPTLSRKIIEDGAYDVQCYHVTRLDEEGGAHLLGNVVRIYMALEVPECDLEETWEHHHER